MKKKKIQISWKIVTNRPKIQVHQWLWMYCSLQVREVLKILGNWVQTPFPLIRCVLWFVMFLSLLLFSSWWEGHRLWPVWRPVPDRGIPRGSPTDPYRYEQTHTHTPTGRSCLKSHHDILDINNQIMSSSAAAAAASLFWVNCYRFASPMWILLGEKGVDSAEGPIVIRLNLNQDENDMAVQSSSTTHACTFWCVCLWDARVCVREMRPDHVHPLSLLSLLLYNWHMDR